MAQMPPPGMGQGDLVGAGAPDPSAAFPAGRARARGSVDPMMLIAFVMQQMGPGATPEQARELLMQVGSGAIAGPAPGLEAAVPLEQMASPGPMAPPGPMPSPGMGGAPMGPTPAGPGPGEFSDPLFPGMNP